MNKPSLTPHADEVAKITTAFKESLAASSRQPGHDETTSQMTALIVPAILMAIAEQRDLRRSPMDIANGLIGALANGIMSGALTVANAKSLEGHMAEAAVWLAMQQIDDAVEQRFECAGEKIWGAHAYDDPDRAPGRA